MDIEIQGRSPFGRSWLHKPWFRFWRAVHHHWLLSFLAGPMWYSVLELDPKEEKECLSSFQGDATIGTGSAVLRQALRLDADATLPATFEAALGALINVFPLSDDRRRKTAQEIRALRETTFRGNGEELDEECKVHEKRLLWEYLLEHNQVPVKLKAELFAWNRAERDKIYRQVEGQTFFRTFNVLGCRLFAWCPTLWFFKKSVAKVHDQEKRFKTGVPKGFFGRLAFWILLLLMVAGVIAPDTLNFFLEAYLAVLRSLPNRPQAALMAFAIWDYPYADARLALFLGRTRFYGLLPTFIIGVFKKLDPEFSASFKGIKVLVWACAVSTVWQMLMHNGKSIYDLFFFLLVREQSLTGEDYATMDQLVFKLRLCNMYTFAYIDHFKVSNRAGAQLSYHKQDQEDALSCLKWSARIVEDGWILRLLVRRIKREGDRARVVTHVFQSGDMFGKFCVWVAIILIGVVICASCFPSDPYAGLIAFAYYAPLSVRAAGDVWDPSQSFEDVLRLFTTTAGPTLPSTVALIVNLGWWIRRRVGLFIYLSVRFWCTLAGLFCFTLPTRLWGEWIKDFGEFFKRKLTKRRVVSAIVISNFTTVGNGSVFGI